MKTISFLDYSNASIIARSAEEQLFARLQWVTLQPRRTIVQQAVNNHVLFDYVLADNWFGSKANMAFIHETLRKSFIFESLCSNDIQ